MKLDVQQQLQWWAYCNDRALQNKPLLYKYLFLASWTIFFAGNLNAQQCGAICDDLVTVTLNSTGLGAAPATTFDEGTAASCCVDFFEVKRMTDPDAAFNSSVVFSCADVDNGPVSVILRVVGCDGSTSTCMSLANVEDNIDPVLACPNPMTVGCGLGDSSPSMTGQPEVTEACGVADLFYIDNTFDTNCGGGFIERVWTATDPSGNAGTCVQIINIEDTTPLMVDFPDDYTVNSCVTVDDLDPEDLPAPFDFPVINGDDCEMVFQSHEDFVFTASGNSCIKILRTWKIIDWCVYNPGGTDGLYEDVQIIKVNDNAPPTYDCPEDYTVAFLDSDCDTDITIPMPDNIDDCLPDVDVHVSGVLGTGFSYEDVGEGTYGFTYTLTDGCGNSSSCSINVTVVDGNAPDFVCLNGLAVSLMPSGMIALAADDFIQYVSDNCTATSNIQLRIGGAPEPGQDDPPAENSIVFTCDDLGNNVVAIWAGDEAGNWDYCLTYVEIQDNSNGCNPITGGISLGGYIQNEDGAELENIMVRLNEDEELESMTDSIGGYMFEPIEPGIDYSIKPEKDTSYMEGVNTLDLIYLMRHITGTDPLESPYKIIAADIDNSGNVSIMDAISLQRCILSVTDTFPNNTSWRFVKSSYLFPNPLNPFTPPFPEQIEADSMLLNMFNADFVGIKVGDLDNSSMASALQETTDRSGNLLLYTKEQQFNEGEKVMIEVRAADLASLAGMQWAFELDLTSVKWESVLPGVIPMDGTNAHLSKDGQLRFSWATGNAYTVKQDDILFTIVLEALADNNISNIFQMNSQSAWKKAYLSNNLNKVETQLFVQQGDASTLEVMEAYPNPTAGQTMIPFVLPQQAEVQLNVWDSNGQLIFSNKQIFAAGQHAWAIEANDLPVSGTYWYEVKTDGKTSRAKLVKL